MRQIPNELLDTFLDYLSEFFSAEVFRSEGDPIARARIGEDFLFLWKGKQCELAGQNKDLIDAVYTGFHRHIAQVAREIEKT